MEGVELSAAELRAVARFALESATGLLPRFEAELPDDPRPRAALEAARERATPLVRDVLRRYPPAPAGRNRLAQLQHALDAALREVARAASAPDAQAG